MAKILFVVTGTSYWTLKDGTRHPTGYWAEEFAAPYDAFSKAGHEIVVATPGGTVPYVDVMSLRPSMAGSAEIAEQLETILRSAEELRRPIQLAAARLDDYDAVYYPGGHGPMEDLWRDADSGRLLIAALASGKPLAIVCHAPAAILATRRDGKSPFAGYRVTAFTNDEEDGVGLREGTVDRRGRVGHAGCRLRQGRSMEAVHGRRPQPVHRAEPASAGPLAEKLLTVLD